MTSQRSRLRRLRWRLAHSSWKYLFHHRIRQLTGQPVARIDPGEPQPPELSLATSALREADVELHAQPDAYFAGAYREAAAICKALRAVGFQLRPGSTVMEMGCGSARVLRLLRCAPGVRLIGTDVNRDCIDWCRAHVPGIDFYHHGTTPPLPFLADDSVDLVLAISVFTHIAVGAHAPWLRELRRILKPGGMFACTLLGKAHRRLMLTADELRGLERQGQLSLSPDADRVSLSSRHTRQSDVFLTRAEAVRSFGAILTVRSYLERSTRQDLIILAKEGTSRVRSSPRRRLG